MGRLKRYELQIQVRLEPNQLARVREYRTYLRNRNGVNISEAEAIRALIELALTQLGLINEEENGTSGS